MSVFSNYGINKTNDISVVAESVIDTINSIETLEEGVFTYTASMVPVAMRETSMGTKYIMEYDMLKKLECDQHLSITEAFEAVCEENDIDKDDAYVLIDDPERRVNAALASYDGTEDINDSVEFESSLINFNNDIEELSEAGAEMLYVNSYLEFGSVNPAIKKEYMKDVSDFEDVLMHKHNDPKHPVSDEKANADYDRLHKAVFNKAFNKCQTIADYKYLMARADSFVNPSIGKELKSKCQNKIDELQDEKAANKAAYKQLKIDERRQKKADRQAAKNSKE
jgi:hypothetical protein